MDRRLFMAGVGAAALTVAAAPAASAFESPKTPLYRQLVPEIFAPLPHAPEHTEAIVIGSGFGAAVAALRLAKAGVGVSVLERGSRWPNDPNREIFVADTVPDGRGFWHRNVFVGMTRMPFPVDSFGGVLCVDNFPGIDVWRAACVGGGSVVFTGAMLAPEQRFFDQVFRGSVNYGEMASTYYPRVRQMLRLSPMPADIYHSPAFAHSRAWDEQARQAGYTPHRIDGIWNWNVIRDELSGRSRPSATVGCSNLGNSNGAKFDLNQNYLRYAEGTGKARIYPGHRVDSIAAEPGGRYSVRVSVLAPTGTVLATRTLTCDRLFLGAGSVGTSELLVRARATGALRNLNEHVGQGWGTNGDVGLSRTLSGGGLGTQGAASASRVLDESGTPTSVENWYIPGATFGDVGLLASLGMSLDPARGSFRHEPSGRVTLDWAPGANNGALATATALNRKTAAGARAATPPIFESNATFTAHPLGGAVLGRATDGYGRVHGHKGLYVIDGAAIPGSTGTVNPSLTITALAERNMERIIRQ